MATTDDERFDYLGRLHRLHARFTVILETLSETEDDLARQSLAAGASYAQVGEALGLTGTEVERRLRSHVNAGR